MKAKPIYSDIDGAPFYIGARVKIAKLTDKTGNQSLIGKSGEVVYYEYSCGSGQNYPEDPMIGVSMDLLGNDEKIIEEFWKEELTVIPDFVCELSA